MSRLANMSGISLLFTVFAILLALLPLLTLATADFALSLYDEIYVPKPTDSVLIAPTNLKAALAVAALAAKGKTRDEITKSIDSTSETLANDLNLPGNLGNIIVDRQIYVGSETLDAHFEERVSSAYKIQKVVFGEKNTTKAINHRVKEVTKKRIDAILPTSINRNTILAAVNSVYMKAEWKKEFSSIVRRGFKKPMYHQYGTFAYANLTKLNAEALILEFKGNNVKLLVLEPYDNDLKALGEKLLKTKLTDIPPQLSSTYMSLYFPIIKEIKMQLNVKDIMTNLGLDRSLGNKANFASITDNCDEEDIGTSLEVIRQHTSFKISRTGAEFASVIGLQMDLKSNQRSACSCLLDESEVELDDDAEVEDKPVLTARMKEAKHYIFDRKLFFALIENENVLLIGTLAMEKLKIKS